MQKPWYETAKLLMKAKGIPQASMAKALQVTPGAVSHYLNGRRECSLDQIKLIAAHLGVELGELLDPRELFYLEYRKDRYTALDREHMVPLISWDRARKRCAGIFLADEEPSEHVPVPHVVGKGAYALRVEGDSMMNPTGNPTFPAGSTIIVDPTVESKPSRMVVARVGDDITFRQLVVEAGRSYLKPLNNLYPLTPAKDATICGVVVGKAYEPIL